MIRSLYTGICYRVLAPSMMLWLNGGWCTAHCRVESSWFWDTLASDGIGLPNPGADRDQYHIKWPTVEDTAALQYSYYPTGSLLSGFLVLALYKVSKSCDNEDESSPMESRLIRRSWPNQYPSGLPLLQVTLQPHHRLPKK